MLSEEDAAVSPSFREQRLALVERIMLARIIGDFDFLESVSAPDIVVKLIGDKALIPHAGTYRGVKEAPRFGNREYRTHLSQYEAGIHHAGR